MEKKATVEITFKWGSIGKNKRSKKQHKKHRQWLQWRIFIVFNTSLFFVPMPAGAKLKDRETIVANKLVVQHIFHAAPLMSLQLKHVDDGHQSSA